MPKRCAHVFEEKWRSDDVKLREDVEFSSLLLSEKVLAGLKKSGFKSPSPIQLEAIPIGRVGKDLVVQAKSGTGKTLVFTIVALEMLLKVPLPQVLILAPTREIAFQICDIIKSVGCKFHGLSCEVFIGGLPLPQDTKKAHSCQIAVGTPGRIKQLISLRILKTNSIRLFVLDEADQLMDPSFKPDINAIFISLPKEKQVIATSATYPKSLKKLLSQYFREPFIARLNVDKLALLGTVHYYSKLEISAMPVLAYKAKLNEVERILTSVKFTQCVVFCNLLSRVEGLCSDIKNLGFSATFISSAKEQGDRLKAIEALKKFKCKVLVSSDLTSRGIDAENVDLIINFDIPSSPDIYLHRVGRAGRYGSKGVAITLVSEEQMVVLRKIECAGNFRARPLPDPIPENLVSLRPEPTDSTDESSSSEISDEEELLDACPKRNTKKDLFKEKDEKLDTNEVADEMNGNATKEIEDTNSVSESEEESGKINDKEFDSETNESEISCVVSNESENSGVVSNEAENSGVVSKESENSGVVSNEAENSGVVSKESENSGVVTKVSKNSGLVWNESENSGVVPNDFETNCSESAELNTTEACPQSETNDSECIPLTEGPERLPDISNEASKNGYFETTNNTKKLPFSKNFDSAFFEAAGDLTSVSEDTGNTDTLPELRSSLQKFHAAVFRQFEITANSNSSDSNNGEKDSDEVAPIKTVVEKKNVSLTNETNIPSDTVNLIENETEGVAESEFVSQIIFQKEPSVSSVSESEHGTKIGALKKAYKDYQRSHNVVKSHNARAMKIARQKRKAVFDSIIKPLEASSESSDTSESESLHIGESESSESESESSEIESESSENESESSENESKSSENESECSESEEEHSPVIKHRNSSIQPFSHFHKSRYNIRNPNNYYNSPCQRRLNYSERIHSGGCCSEMRDIFTYQLQFIQAAAYR